MPLKKNNITVMVAPLDWGLGHATRCIPIIRILVKNGCTVLIATSGHHKNLLQAEFPDLRFLDLPGYGIRYGKVNVLLRLMLQLPLFFRNVRQEHKWLQKAIDTHAIDAVISDNRYGLHSPKATCVFITHQLQVQSPSILKWTEKNVRSRLYRFIRHFDACWVPDAADKKKSLGGQLSHPAVLPMIPVIYVGWLTRFIPQPVKVKKYKLVISLSGPEPQRTLLEDVLLVQLQSVTGEVLLVRGLPGNDEAIAGAGLSPAQIFERVHVAVNRPETGVSSGSTRAGASPAPTQNNLTIRNHLPGPELQKAIAESEFFMSRCGYSTLMDLQAVACRCLFVPTPGQTEQEYLGKQITISQKALVLNQKNINLSKALTTTASLPYFSDGNYQNTELEKILIDWLDTIRKV